ncbi:IS5 family transposase [Kocuria sp. CPCC 205263]|uniref:IS5 family transposase n=1 Tax=Kocuria sp. CPCC 205263 TaxID=3073555 RepID=UPI0034D43126
MATRKYQWMVDDRLWEPIAPLLPPPAPARGPCGRPRIDDRAALEGILFVLHTGCRWRDLPVELGCGSGHTAWRRLHHWQQAGVWEQLHRAVLEELSEEEILDWSGASIDSVSVRAKGGGELTGPNPTDRGKPGTKYHLLTDRNGLPLHVLASAANVHDSRLFGTLLDTNPGVRGRRGHPGRPRRRPQKLHADKGYDYPRCRRYLHRRGIKVRIARRGIEDKNHLGRHRWVVERTISWVLRFKRLGLRYDRTEATLLPLLLLAVTLINLRRLNPATEL